MATELSNRSLARGIAILRALSDMGPSTLADLHRHSGLPKSTLRRLLATLVENRLVRRSISDGKFRLNLTLPADVPDNVEAFISHLIGVATPHMKALTAQVGWPCDLHVRDKHRMLVIESSRPLSPFHIHQSTVDLPVNIFASASGRVVLSTLSDDAIRALAEDARADPYWSLERFYPGEDEFLKRIAQVRAQGYSARHRGYGGESTSDDNLRVIAVPIFWQGEAAASLALLWTKEYQSPERFARDHLAALRQAADSISDAL
ncbi:MAG: helix-turn-helix domain-containing protein [Pseudomonadota bacterium]